MRLRLLRETPFEARGRAGLCPYIPSLRTVDWALPDPKRQSLEAVRAIRDQIHERVKELIRSERAECCKAV
jgi:protein-tyrosine-phosphatase